MSASREKKQRQGDGLSEKQRREAEEAQKARSKKILYTVIGIVCAVLVIALLVWNSNFFQRRTVAATVGDKQYTVGDVAFYYNNAKQTIRNYANYGLVTYNASLADDQQTIDDTTAQNLSLYVGLTAEAGQTYAKFFQDRALEALQNEALLCAAAAEDGYTLSDAGKQSVEESVTSYKQSATDYGYTLAAYLRAVYGPYMTESTFREHLTNSTLASEYAQHYQESLTYSDEELTAYYQEHADTMDTFDFRAFYISGAPAAKTDADGNTVEATDEEKAAAMGLAKTQADAMLRRLQDGEAFNAAAKDYAAEDAKANYDDPDYNRQTRLGSAVASYDYAEWLTDSARKDGDVTVVESSSGYYVLQFHGRRYPPYPGHGRDRRARPERGRHHHHARAHRGAVRRRQGQDRVDPGRVRSRRSDGRLLRQAGGNLFRGPRLQHQRWLLSGDPVYQLLRRFQKLVPGRKPPERRSGRHPEHPEQPVGLSSDLLSGLGPPGLEEHRPVRSIQRRHQRLDREPDALLPHRRGGKGHGQGHRLTPIPRFPQRQAPLRELLSWRRSYV